MNIKKVEVSEKFLLEVKQELLDSPYYSAKDVLKKVNYYLRKIK